MDAFLLRRLLPELAGLTGTRVHSADQTDARTVELDLRRGGSSSILALSCDPVFPRVEPLAAPELRMKPGPFVQTLRAHLPGAVLEGIRQIGFDRVVVFEFTRRRAFSTPEQLNLMLQLFGRRANLYLESTAGALASLRPGVIPRARPHPESAGRAERRRLDPLSVPHEELKEGLRGRPDSDLRSALVERFTGVSPFWAEEICFRADLDPGARLAALRSWQIDLLWSHLAAWIEMVKNAPPDPCVYYEPNTDLPVAVSPIPAEHLPDKTCRRFERVSDAVSGFYRATVPSAREAGLLGGIQRRYRNDLRRVTRSLERVSERRRAASREAEFRRFGELILSNLNTLIPGKNEVTVIDHYNDHAGRIHIPVDPSKSPRANAEAYFGKARKARRGRQALAAEIAKLESRRGRLEREIEALSSLRGEELRSRAQALGLLPVEPADRRSAKERPIPFRTFQTRDGWTVWVGRNDRQNDLLTHSRAAPHDYWFHARGLAGSHVVLRVPDRRQRPSKRAILEVAQIAAYYSKGRSSKTVDVTYTQKKYVRKPRRGRPGLALVANEEVVFVEPRLPLGGSEETR